MAATTGLPGIMVMGPSYPGSLDSLPGLRIVPSLPGGELAHVLASARFAMLGGGDMLGQAICLGVPVVAAPVGKDQSPRVAAYSRLGLCLTARAGTLAATVREELTDLRLAELRKTIQSMALGNGMDEALDQIESLLTTGDRPT